MDKGDRVKIKRYVYLHRLYPGVGPSAHYNEAPDVLANIIRRPTVGTDENIKRVLVGCNLEPEGDAIFLGYAIRYLGVVYPQYHDYYGELEEGCLADREGVKVCIVLGGLERPGYTADDIYLALPEDVREA